MTDEEKNTKMHNNRAWWGFILLVVGAVLLLQKMGSPFPDWVFSWPMILIAVGLLVGIRKKFQNNGWIILVLVGCYFLVNDFFPQLNAGHYATPVLLMAIGLLFILRPHKCNTESIKRYGDNNRYNDFATGSTEASDYSNDDFLDITSVLGGTKKNILSKNFKGGDVTSLLGGTELNLSQADISGRVVLDITSILGGTKLIIPSNWDVKAELVSIFGGIEDKRQLTGTIDHNKVLVLKGTSFLGGIEIKSY